MQSMFPMLSSLGHWNWFILAVLLFILETVVPGVHFLWFGLAAVVVGCPRRWQRASAGRGS